VTVIIVPSADTLMTVSSVAFSPWKVVRRTVRTPSASAALVIPGSAFALVSARLLPSCRIV
jgi:hypothetical protein